MYTTLHCICLRTVRYNDSSAILSAYSRECGLMSFQISSGQSKEGRRRKALTMPLSFIECICDIRTGRDIHTIKELIPWGCNLLAINAHPIKTSIAVFLAEILSIVLRDSHPDSILFDYIATGIQRLAKIDQGIGNFHLSFLYGLSRFLGIEPDLGTWKQGYIFDMSEGIFRPTPPLHTHYLSPEKARTVAALAMMSERNLNMFRLNRKQRNDILDGILEYYSIHFSHISSISSIQVLRETMG